MKNKALISFCINILVGLLFSFPVFSAQNISNIKLANEISISCNELCINHVAGSNHKLKKEYPKFLNLSETESVKKISHYKNSYPAHSSPQVEYYFNQYYDLTSSFNAYINSTYVDLSYLTELEVTKMLC